MHDVNKIKGRKIKCFLWYYGADDEDGDVFVPIYYGEKIPKKRIKIKKRVIVKKIKKIKKIKKRNKRIKRRRKK